MDGYRKLKVGEVIKDGDVVDSTPPFETVCAGKIIGDVGTKCCTYYRKLPPKAKNVKKYPRRIDVSKKIEDIIIMRSGFGCPDATKEIVKFIQNNYRRRQKGGN